jgi:methylase of polypeptide subunit release factors
MAEKEFMKLTKAQTKAHAEAMALINDTKRLGFDEIEFCYENFHPGSEHNQTVAGAFFTPSEYAKNLATFCSDAERVVDVCAGIGVLTFRMQCYCNIGHIRCVELNPEYLRIGRRLLPECEWVKGNALDGLLWGTKMDYAISNPPFGTIPKHFMPEVCMDASWTKCGLPFHLTIAAMSLELTRAGAIMIIPDIDHSQENKRGIHPGPSSNYERFVELTEPHGRITPCSCDICDEFTGAKGVKCMVVDVSNHE